MEKGIFSTCAYCGHEIYIDKQGKRKRHHIIDDDDKFRFGKFCRICNCDKPT